MVAARCPRRRATRLNVTLDLVTDMERLAGNAVGDEIAEDRGTVVGANHTGAYMSSANAHDQFGQNEFTR
jgi:hypothetical protein